MRIPRTTLSFTALALFACSEAPSPTEVSSADLTVAADAALGKVEGGGHYAIVLGGGLTLDAQFAVSAQQTDTDETARGTFHHRTELFGDGIDFHGTVTCLAIDAAKGRAWIGGVVTKNRSVREPFASGDIYQPGRDIWFRVLDVGQPPDGADRTTFVGFEGGGGIITSAEYCDAKIWPEGDARTNALTSGNLIVMP